MTTLSVKNFERFQHYKDRSPPWIKLYNETLEDYELGALPDATKAHLILIWLLASRMENKLPHDARWIANKINATEPVDLDALIAAGFLVPYSQDIAKGKREDWPSRYIPDDVRVAVMARDGSKCCRCGSPERLEIDHIKPVSQGGTGAMANLQVLCISCNRKKRAEQMRSTESARALRSCVAEPEQKRSLETERETEQRREEPKGSLSPSGDEEVLKTAVEYFNATAERSGLPQCQTLNKRRRAGLLARLHDCGGLSGWIAALEKLAASPHCRGENDRGWRADFDFLIQAKSFTRLMEGSYDKRIPAARPNSLRDSWQQAEEYLEQRDRGKDGGADDNLVLSRLPTGAA